MPDEWDITEDEIDSWLEEWEAADRAAAQYLAERIPGVRDVPSDDEARWLDAVAETISPSEEPKADEIEAASAVMALQHADWLGLALGAVRRGAGSALDAELEQVLITCGDSPTAALNAPMLLTKLIFTIVKSTSGATAKMFADSAVPWPLSSAVGFAAKPAIGRRSGLPPPPCRSLPYVLAQNDAGSAPRDRSHSGRHAQGTCSCA